MASWSDEILIPVSPAMTFVLSASGKPATLATKSSGTRNAGLQPISMQAVSYVHAFRPEVQHRRIFVGCYWRSHLFAPTAALKPATMKLST